MSNLIKHSGKAKRHAAFCSLVSDLIPIEGLENVGRIWVLKSRTEWANLMSVTPQTITTLAKIPPLESAVFLAEDESGRKIKALAIRVLKVGEGPLQPIREKARIMEALFRENLSAGADPRRWSRTHWGMLNGLAQEWPEGYQIDIFKHLLTKDGWASFMAALGQFIAVQNECQAASYRKRYYKYPTITVMRAFPHVAADAFKSDMQLRGEKTGFPYHYDLWAPV